MLTLMKFSTMRYQVLSHQCRWRFLPSAMWCLIHRYVVYDELYWTWRQHTLPKHLYSHTNSVTQVIQHSTGVFIGFINYFMTLSTLQKLCAKIKILGQYPCHEELMAHFKAISYAMPWRMRGNHDKHRTNGTLIKATF